MADFEVNEDTPLLRRFSIPPVFTQPACFEQMSDKMALESDYNTSACKSWISPHPVSLLFPI